MKKILFVLITFCSFNVIIYSQEAVGKEIIAIMPFTVPDSNTYVTTGNDIASAWHGKLLDIAQDKYTIVSRDENVLNATTKELAIQREKNYTDQQTILDYGAGANAAYVLAGTLHNLGNNKEMIFVGIYDVKKASLLAGSYKVYEPADYHNELDMFVDKHAKRLLDSIKKPTTAKTLTVIPFESKTLQIKDENADIITRMLSIDIANEGKYSLVVRSHDDLLNIQKEITLQRQPHFTDKQTRTERGKNLNAEYIVSSHMNKFEDIKLIYASVLDLKTSQQYIGDYTEYTSEKDIFNYIPKLAKSLSKNFSSTTDKQTLSIHPFISEDIDISDYEKELLAQILSINLANTGRYAVISRLNSHRDGRNQEFLNQKQKNTTDTNTTVERDKASNAELTFLGIIRHVRGKKFAIVNFIGVEDTATKGNANSEYTTARDLIMTVIPKLAEESTGIADEKAAAAAALAATQKAQAEKDAVALAATQKAQAEKDAVAAAAAAERSKIRAREKAEKDAKRAKTDARKNAFYSLTNNPYEKRMDAFNNVFPSYISYNYENYACLFGIIPLVAGVATITSILLTTVEDGNINQSFKMPNKIYDSFGNPIGFEYGKEEAKGNMIGFYTGLGLTLTGIIVIMSGFIDSSSFASSDGLQIAPYIASDINGGVNYGFNFALTF